MKASEISTMSGRVGEFAQRRRIPWTCCAQPQVGAYVYPVVPIQFNLTGALNRSAGRRTPGSSTSTMAELTVTARRCGSCRIHHQQLQLYAQQAKQMVPCSYDGYVISDGILFYSTDELLACGLRTDSVPTQTGGQRST
jgi:hypothetical protein